jgi:hypothetical protein
MSLVGFEPAILACEQLQSLALDRAATGISNTRISNHKQAGLYKILHISKL